MIGMTKRRRRLEVERIVGDTMRSRSKVRELVTFLLEVTGACVDAGCPSHEPIPAFIRRLGAKRGQR